MLYSLLSKLRDTLKMSYSGHNCDHKSLCFHCYQCGHIKCATCGMVHDEQSLTRLLDKTDAADVIEFVALLNMIFHKKNMMPCRYRSFKKLS